jgi:hypothetical protein
MAGILLLVPLHPLYRSHLPMASLQPLGRGRRSVREVTLLPHPDPEHCVDCRVVVGISPQDHGSATLIEIGIQIEIGIEIGTGTGIGVVTIGTGVTRDPVAVIGLGGNDASPPFLNPLT